MQKKSNEKKKMIGPYMLNKRLIIHEDLLLINRRKMEEIGNELKLAYHIQKKKPRRLRNIWKYDTAIFTLFELLLSVLCIQLFDHIFPRFSPSLVGWSASTPCPERCLEGF